MAKVKQEKNAIQVAADTAREHYSKAKEANEKTDNETTRKALVAAKEKRDAAVNAERRDRFERVGGGRVGTAINAIVNVGKMNVPSSYSFTEADLVKAESAMKQAVEQSFAALRASLNTSSVSKTEKKGFSF